MDEETKRVVSGIIELITEMESEYEMLRKRCIDFDDKNILAEGVAALSALRRTIKEKYNR